MASKVEYGTSSKDVLDMQKYINSTFGTKIPENGTYDDDMAAAVNDLAGKIGYKGSVKAIDPAFQKAMKEAAEPRAIVQINGKPVAVTKAQLDALRLVAGKKAVESVRPYLNMMQEAKGYWDAHEKARSDNWFWSGVVDVAVGTKFPSAGLMNAAIAEAKSLEADARACALKYEDLSRRTTKIREAFAAMDQYREELFMGGEKLVDNLETIKTGCVITLQVAAALGTGGLSWQVQVGVSAGVAAYEAALKEVSKASTDGSYSIPGGIANVFASAAVDGAAGYLLKGAGVGKFLDDVAKKAVEEAGAKVLLPFAIKAVNGGAQQMIKDGIKAIPGIFDPTKKIKLEDVIKGAAKSFVIGASLKNLGKVCEKYGKSVGKWFDISDFERLAKGAADLDKAGAEAVKKAIEKVGPKVVEAVVDEMQVGWSERQLEEKIRKGILRDPAVIRAAQDAINDAKAGKKGKK
jgi:hypothetical protein